VHQPFVNAHGFLPRVGGKPVMLKQARVVVVQFVVQTAAKLRRFVKALSNCPLFLVFISGFGYTSILKFARLLNRCLYVSALLFLACCAGETRTGIRSTTRVKLPALDSSLSFSDYTAKATGAYWNKMADIFQYSGVVLLARRDSFWLWKAGEARAGKNLSDAMPMQIASASKPFCAVALMLLREQGKIRLNDTLRKFFPQLPYYNITIENLLSHGSGLPEYIFLADKYFGKNRGVLRNADVIDMLAKAKEPAWFAPGKKHHYCNTNFVLLASIVEKVSGMSYPDFLKQNVFLPLGMYHTRVLKPHEKASEQLVQGHYGTGLPFPDNYQDGTYGDKNIVSTVWDLYRFYKGLRLNLLLPMRAREELFTTRFTRTRGNSAYALGFRKREAGDTVWMFHSGWWHGFRSNFYFNLKADICAVVLTNRLSGGFIPSGIMMNMHQPAELQKLVNTVYKWESNDNDTVD
jgi:CubicO group peptidase (beta-lactamase class C family)